MATFVLVVFKVILGSFRALATFSYNFKTLLLLQIFFLKLFIDVRWCKISAGRTLVTYINCTFMSNYSSKSVWGHSVRFSQNGLYMKSVGRGAKRTEIWDSEALVTRIWGTFDIVMFMVIWGHSVQLSQMVCK